MEFKKTFYGEEDCCRTMYADVANKELGNIGCIGVLKVEVLCTSYKEPKYQLFMITGGFGAYPEKMGNAVYGYFIADHEDCRMERYDFIGILNEEMSKEFLL